MSDKHNDGGPAFPVPEIDGMHGAYPVREPGMTLRDYFAAQALGGLLVSAEEHFTGNGRSEEAVSDWHRNVEANWAAFSYRMADAMLAARASSKP